MDAVVFDLDATLAVVERDRATLLDEATTAAGAPDLSRSDYLRAHRADHAADTREPIFDRLLDETTGPDATADTDPGDLASAYREAIGDALEPVPGVETLLADLRDSYRVGLLTNGPASTQRGKLERLGWTDAFDAVVVTGDLPAGKPDPRAFAAVLDGLGVSATRAVHVGDEVEADVRGARDAGLAAVQVRYDGGPAPSPHADAVVWREDLVDELPGVIRDLAE